MTNFVKYTSEFGLTVQTIQKEVKVELVVVPNNHIVVIDVSGSMFGDLPELRKQLKNKLPSLVKDKDTVTLIWFSGKNQFGILQEEVEVKSLSDLSKLNEAIDRFLQPVGLTGFKQPLEAVSEVVNRIKKNRPNSTFSLFFMSDGYDNQWAVKEILDVADSLKTIVDTATVVEFGWSADRNLLSKIADTIGGSLVFSQDFSAYDVQFSNSISKHGVVSKKRKIELVEIPELDYVFTWGDDGEITTYSIEDNAVLVPENLASIAYYSKPNDNYSREYDTETYIGLITLSQRMKADEIFDVLGATGDVYLANKFTNSFSKQDYIDFQNDVLVQALNPSKRYVDGKDKYAIPNETAYTVLHLLDDLASDEGNLIYPSELAKIYTKIGAGTVQKDESIKFEIEDKEAGVPLDGLVYNSSRPNVSLRVKRNGFVKLPDSTHYGLPDNFPTHIYRNYNIVRDGIVNTRQLPVSLTQKTLDKLVDSGVFRISDKPFAGELFFFDISHLPIINRSMTKRVFAKDLFAKVFELEKLKAAQKVFKYFRDKYAEAKTTGFVDRYGADATTWLKEIGITDGGFSPPSDRKEFNDFYVAKELVISVAGLSSLPKVEDVITKMKDTSGKVTIGTMVMSEPILRAQEFLESSIYKNASDKGALLTAWLDSEAKFAINRTRTLNAELSQIKAAIILGHTWFIDLAPGENTLTFKVAEDLSVSLYDQSVGKETPGTFAIVTANLRDKEIGNKE